MFVCGSNSTPERITMALFRRRKKGDAPREDKLEHPSSKSLKEEVLQGQVDGLQEEMKRLNERLLEMQSNVQNRGNASPPSATGVNFPLPSVSQRLAPNQPTHLSNNQSLRNRSIRKKKGIMDVFVPCEIDLISNETFHKGKDDTRPKIFHDEPPIHEIETRKLLTVEKPNSMIKVKNHHRPQLQVVGDAESTTSSQRSSVSMKNGRKVKRVIRKVRAVPTAKSTSKMERSIAKDTAPKRGLMEDIRSDVKLNTVDQSSERNFQSKPDFSHEDLRKASQRSRHDTKTSRTPEVTPPNRRNCLLEGIKAGLELKKVDGTTEQSQKSIPNAKSSFLEGIKAGVELKQIDPITEKPKIKPRDPKSALLEGIKAGVKLKQVDRSLLQEKKKQETPMSALLANIQKRKKECLRHQEQQCVDNGIDW